MLNIKLLTYFIIVLVTLITLPSALIASTKSNQINIFAASSLIVLLSDIKEYFEKTSDLKLTYSFASSSTLANQISRGAPSDIYISANSLWMNYLEEKKLLETNHRQTFLINQLALVAHVNRAKPINRLNASKINSLLGTSRLSLGDYRHVPAGIYAKQAITKFGLWETLKDRLTLSQNVRSTLTLVERKETSLGIIFLTDALSSNQVKTIYVFPEHAHDKIVYEISIIRGKFNRSTESFYRFLQGNHAREAITRLGFKIP
ncbi:MAG: molybdate ABC transporter substrate-binding protein [Pseudomonadota bacterium]|nr:molybdate ABC transporter substrate-binding protein [Pseudomonadota bacterium]